MLFRMVADVDGDGRVDIIGFNSSNVKMPTLVETVCTDVSTRDPNINCKCRVNKMEIGINKCYGNDLILK